jgi:hypothetical protein
MAQVNGIVVWTEGIKAELAERLPQQRKTWVRGAGAHAAEVATDNPLNSLVFGIDRSAQHSKIIDTRMLR